MATHTVKQTGGDFSTLASALSDAGTSASDTISIEGTWSIADTAAATVSDNTVTIQTDTDSKHPGYVSNSDHYRLEVSGSHCVTVNNTGLIIDGIVIKQSGTGSSNEGIRIGVSSGTTTIKKSIIWASTSTSQQDGLFMYEPGTANVEQCFIYGFNRAGCHAQPSNSGNDQTWNINSCGIWDCGKSGETSESCGGIAVRQQSVANGVIINLFNIWILDCNGDADASDLDYHTGSGGVDATWNINNCIDSDGSITNRIDTGSNNLTSHNITDDNTKSSDGDWVIVEDITSSPYDLRLQDNTYNEAQDAHTVTSGSGMNIPTDDIVGTSRPQNTDYDLGAFEISVGGATVIPTNPLHGPLGGPLRGII